jgi:hypothetical protein
MHVVQYLGLITMSDVQGAVKSARSPNPVQLFTFCTYSSCRLRLTHFQSPLPIFHQHQRVKTRHLTSSFSPLD